MYGVALLGWLLAAALMFTISSFGSRRPLLICEPVPVAAAYPLILTNVPVKAALMVRARRWLMLDAEIMVRLRSGRRCPGLSIDGAPRLRRLPLVKTRP